MLNCCISDDVKITPSIWHKVPDVGGTRETDIEHIVAASEAHDSGLCAAVRGTKARFARDLRNLTLASPKVNRHEKPGKDAGEWLPARNKCWFAGGVLKVKHTYGLTVDRWQAEARERVLSSCTTTTMEPFVCVLRAGAAGASGTAAISK